MYIIIIFFIYLKARQVQQQQQHQLFLDKIGIRFFFFLIFLFYFIHLVKLGSHFFKKINRSDSEIASIKNGTRQRSFPVNYVMGNS